MATKELLPLAQATFPLAEPLPIWEGMVKEYGDPFQMSKRLARELEKVMVDFRTIMAR
jgi:hypothetical protein